MKNTTILVVEDDLQILELISLYLLNSGFSVVKAVDGVTALQVFEREAPQLVLLDINLPEMNGFDLCNEIRSVSNTPIIIISCNSETEDIMRGLEIGADDYVTKPFDPNVLVARVKANLRRAPLFRRQAAAESAVVETKPMLRFDGLEIDLSSFDVYVNGRQVSLSAKETQLLTLLASNPNRIFTAEDLYSRVWGVDSNSDTRTVIVHISSLRKKIEPDPASPKYIQNLRGIGYKFQAR
ncbi:response regulator [Paenibacillus chartarius]|uniref:Response regulator n=1 Tax=Paenibacillus chartarius TaxID=747481 RepID=A0ABV6DK96_9BACL